MLETAITGSIQRSNFVKFPWEKRRLRRKPLLTDGSTALGRPFFACFGPRPAIEMFRGPEYEDRFVFPVLRKAADGGTARTS